MSNTQTDTFFARNPVFTTEEFSRFLTEQDPSYSPTGWKPLLTYHRKAGHVVPIRRGLYAVVPIGITPETMLVDPFLIAAKMTDDAVLAYHTALSLHGLAHSVRYRFTSLSRSPFINLTRFQGNTYQVIPPPHALPPDKALALGGETSDRQGVTIRVTGLERTIVDVLHRPAISGGWEEVWLSLESVDAYLDFDLLIEYTLLLKNATTSSKVGYYLDTNRKRLRVKDEHLNRLETHRPRQPQYVQRNRKEGASAIPSRLVSKWNLLVPVLQGDLDEEETEERLT